MPQVLLCCWPALLLPAAVAAAGPGSADEACLFDGMTCESEDDASPLLQVSRVPSTPAQSFWSSITNRTVPSVLSAEENEVLLKVEAASGALAALKWIVFPGDRDGLLFYNRTAAPRDAAKEKATRQKAARQAVTAAALIMIMMTVSVGIQLIMVEFVMTGACATTWNLVGLLGSIGLAVFACLRYVFRVPYRCLTAAMQSCCFCCWWRTEAEMQPILVVFPENILQEVAGCLPVRDLCSLGNASRKMHDLSDNHCSYKSLMTEVKRLRLGASWQRHLLRQTRCEETQSESEEVEVGEPQEAIADSDMEEVAAAVAVDMPEKDASAKAPGIQSITRELRCFLCTRLRRSEEKKYAKEMEEWYNALIDISRYIILVVAWFWFSAEVMDLACSQNPNEMWHILKAISSPCLFLFILESEREHFHWQVIAGLVALVLLMDLLYDGFE